MCEVNDEIIMKRNKILFITHLLVFALPLIILLPSCYEADKSNLIKQKSLNLSKNNKAKKSCCTSGIPARFTKN
jgi:hypothetical protein